MQAFSFNSLEIRVLKDENDEPLLCAKDICAVLEYVNSRKALADHVPLEGVTKRDTLTPGGWQELSYVNESGLYALITGSRSNAAVKFRKWLFEEVLPSIRKTGSYSTQQTTSMRFVTEDAKAYHELAVLFGNSQSSASAQTAHFISREHGRDVKNLLTTNVSDTQDMLQNPTELGYNIGISARAVNSKLAALGLQEKTGKKWAPTESGMEYCQVLDVGKKHSDGTPIQQIKWFKTKTINAISV